MTSFRATSPTEGVPGTNSPEPATHRYVSQRLTLSYVVWEGGPHDPVVLIHGGRDHARSWDDIAQELSRERSVWAPDLRGHGDSEWAQGGHYAMVDFVSDIAALLGVIAADGKAALIGHSLGGAIALQVAAVVPGMVSKVVAIEGLGRQIETGQMPDIEVGEYTRHDSYRIASVATKRPPYVAMREYVRALQYYEHRDPPTYESVEAAAARLRESNPRLSANLAARLAGHSVRDRGDGKLTWKFDNLVRLPLPYEQGADEVKQIWGAIEAPVLLLQGMAQDAEGAKGLFRQAQVRRIDGAGHWVHHDQPVAFLSAIRDFLGTD